MLLGDQVPSILAALRTDQGGQLTRLVEVIVDGVLALRVDELVDVERVLRSLDAALRRTVSLEVIERVLKPAATRERKRARATQEPVEAFFPPAEARAFLELVRRPFPINPRIVNDLVEQKAVRSLLGAVVQEAVQGFVSRAPIPGLSLAVEVMGSLSRRLDQHVGDFLDKSMARLTGRLAELILSEAGLKLIAEMASEMAKITLKTPASFYYEELAKLPVDELWALLPPVLAHNLARPEIQKVLVGEVEAFLRRDGKLIVSELLEQLGIRSDVRRLAIEQVLPVARRVVEQPGFEEWLAGLLG